MTFKIPRTAPQANRFVAGGVAAAAIGVWLRRWPVAEIPGILLAACGAVFVLFCLYFFRDPERPLPEDASKIYSPGDGVVLSIARESGEGAMTLRIFLSIFDVHVQRWPCSGRVVRVEYKTGSFRAAMKAEANANERSIVALEPAGGRALLVVEQIAGLIARRIETWAKAGDSAAAGRRYGIIYFGSQVAVRLPSSARCLVKPGERVVGGITPVAEWTDAGGGPRG